MRATRTATGKAALATRPLSKDQFGEILDLLKIDDAILNERMKERLTDGAVTAQVKRYVPMHTYTPGIVAVGNT